MTQCTITEIMLKHKGQKNPGFYVMKKACCG